MNCRILIGACAVVSCCAAFAGDTSEAQVVFTRPETSSFWHTATGNALTLPIDFPDGASRAALAVRGTTYRADYADITTNAFELTLPAATDAFSEDVYELTLTFTGSDVVRTARLGLIAGLADGAEGVTRCVFGETTRKWPRAGSHAVMPVPYGATAFTVNGVSVLEGDDGFTGAQGWYALPNLAVGSIVPVSLTVGGVSYDASLSIVDRPGMTFFIR